MKIPQLSRRLRAVPLEEAGYQIQHRVIHGYRRAFVEVGRGPAILLIHGIGDNADTWRSVIPALARKHTVIAPDLLGHGRSDKPRADYSIAGYANAMRDLLLVLGHERATVVGHSLGGGVAMQFAYQYPERTERLVLVSTGGVSRSVNPMFRLVAAPNTAWLLPLLRARTIRFWGNVGFKLLSAFDTDLGRDREDLMRVFDALPDAEARAAFVRTLRAAIDWRGQVITMLDRCYLMRDTPTLLVWGTRDAVIPPEHGRIAHATMPRSRLALFEGAGHFPHHADPVRFATLLSDFIDETEPASHDADDFRTLLREGRAAPARTALASRAEEILEAGVRSGT